MSYIGHKSHEFATPLIFDLFTGLVILEFVKLIDYVPMFSPPGEITILKQVRIIPGADVVPEPSTWAMMLLGFGAVGYTMRRRRKGILPQAA